VDVLSLDHSVVHAEEQQDPAYAQRMKKWAHEEGAAGGSGGGGRTTRRATRAGTGMGAVAAGAAVTGHRHRPLGVGASAASSSGSSKKPVMKKTTNNATADTAAAAPVRKTTSALSVVADRRGRFGA